MVGYFLPDLEEKALKAIQVVELRMVFCHIKLGHIQIDESL